MRKIPTFALALFIGCMAANAQVDNTFSFVDADGNIIEHGDTLTRSDIEEDMFMGPLIHSGLSVKKNVSDETYARIDYNITEMTQGTGYQICFGACLAADTVPGEYRSAIPSELGDVTPLMDEWILDITYNGFVENPVANITPGSKMTMVYTIKKVSGPDDDSEGIAGPTVTVNFVYNGSTSINGVEAGANSVVAAYYALDGRRLTSPQKGINIVKYANGKTVKILK